MKWIVVLLILFCFCQGKKKPPAKPTKPPKPTENSNAGCPKGSIGFPDTGRCFFISDSSANYEDAKKACESRKSQLAPAFSCKEQATLSGLLTEYRLKCRKGQDCDEFWIGIPKAKGRWGIFEGTNLKNNSQCQLWEQYSPRKRKGNRVIMSFIGVKKTGVLKNTNCTRKFKFVCSQCPVDFEYFSKIDQCLYLNLDLKNWSDARLACARKAKGAQTLMIKDSVKEEAVRKYLKKQLTSKESQICAKHKLPPKWGKVISTSGQTTDPQKCKTPYLWKPLGEPSIPFTYTNWRPNMPNCRYPNENCAIIITSSYANYRWEDVACIQRLCSICEL